MNVAGISAPWIGLLRDIEKATCFPQCPPDGFDPLRASDDELKDFSLPPKPDKSRFPVRYVFWRKMFTRPCACTPVVRFIPARFEYEAVEGGQKPAKSEDGEVEVSQQRATLKYEDEVEVGLQRSRHHRRSARRVHETSLNWAGASITSGGGRMFTEVHASWRVPVVALPPSAQQMLSEKEGDEFRCSSWIGLDGQRRYVNASLPQIGTSHFVKIVNNKPKMTDGVWWQWWLAGGPNPPPIKLPLKVNPGDEMMASLFVVAERHVKYLIANHTTGEVCTPFIEPIPTTYLEPLQTGHPRPRRHDWPARVSGATAEWITERPMNWTTGEMDQLPAFQPVIFRDCHVVSGRAPGKDEREELPAGAQLINASRIESNPFRSVQVAVAERLCRDSFSTNFVGEPMT